ncbi:MAG: hypothetical protein AAB352_03505 [Patescibacteria group bacterium]
MINKIGLFLRKIKASLYSSPVLSTLIISCLFLFLISLFDRVLAIGAIFIVFLTAITFFIFKKIGYKTKAIYILFLAVLFIQLVAVLFFYYAHFQPFSGGAGDFSTYNSLGQEISERISRGNFSLQGLDIENHYFVIVGYIYALIMPGMLIGQMFNSFLIALLAVFVYLIVMQIGGSEKQGFFAGLMAGIYPSLIFFGGLLGKDALVALLCSIILLLIIKLLKIFSWGNFIFFYIILGALMNLRVYIGFALILTFIASWLLFSSLNFKKRFLSAFLLIIILGFLPQIFSGQGYYGINFLKAFINVKSITYYREKISIPNPKISPTTGFPVYDETPSNIETPASTKPSVVVETPAPEKPSTTTEPVTKRGRGSSIEVETGFDNPFKFLKNSVISFIYTSFGPFPWQMRYLRHLLILPEVVLWYFALFFAIKGIKNLKPAYTFILFFFSFLVLASLSVYLANFGITTRIRIPAFISIFCLAPFGFEKLKNIKIPFLEKYF